MRTRNCVLIQSLDGGKVGILQKLCPFSALGSCSGAGCLTLNQLGKPGDVFRKFPILRAMAHLKNLIFAALLWM